VAAVEQILVVVVAVEVLEQTFLNQPQVVCLYPLKNIQLLVALAE
jgi:hypothetical protein